MILWFLTSKVNHSFMIPEMLLIWHFSSSTEILRVRCCYSIYKVENYRYRAYTNLQNSLFAFSWAVSMYVFHQYVYVKYTFRSQFTKCKHTVNIFFSLMYPLQAFSLHPYFAYTVGKNVIWHAFLRSKMSYSFLTSKMIYSFLTLKVHSIWHFLKISVLLYVLCSLPVFFFTGDLSVLLH